MDEKYDFKQIEAKWQRIWETEDLFATGEQGEPGKYYYLDMFAYPSGNLHWGHVRNYTIGDLICRYHTMKGENVLHPMGWDAFGLPAERAAIKNQIPPREWTEKCISRMRDQLKQLGISYDWKREINTSQPDYYRWTQWLFLLFYKNGLAVRKKAHLNWCPGCLTVLANEQVVQGRCERCDSVVERKEMEQWFFKMTDYADRLLDDHKLLEGNWPEPVLALQRNWIGRSYGVEVDFKTTTGIPLPIYTTRIDTIYGVTYMVLAPEHPVVEELVKGTEREQEVRAFVERILNQSELDRTAEAVEKEGIFTGAYAINPLNGEEVPIWIANYVLMEYGTGAVMAVPAHDTRDFEFAKKYGLPIREVIAKVEEGWIEQPLEEAYTEPGWQVNSGPFDGIPSTEAKDRIADYIESMGIGRRKVHYRLRDWCISRQRYWGAPIPILYCEKCGVVPVPDEDLPVLLPEDVQFTGKGESPLTTSLSFVNVVCPSCGGPARRETDTMDTFVCSSWYYLRYPEPWTDQAAFDRTAVDYWLPVDQYIGGREHATMHLLFARFFSKALYDLGMVSFVEPFTRLFNHGVILLGGKRMSKSRGNIASPDDMVERFGADTARTYVLFIAPPDEPAEWNESGAEGVYRFLSRVWRWYAANIEKFDPDWKSKVAGLDSDTDRMLRRRIHQTIRKVTDDIERFHFNTGISALMEMVNDLYQIKDADPAAISEAMENLALVLSPYAPHMADELWSRIGRAGSCYKQPWPEFDPAIAAEEEITVVVQVNGKVRDRLQVPAETSEKDLEILALASDKVKSAFDGKQVRKVVVVPKKLVNIVVG